MTCATCRNHADAAHSFAPGLCFICAHVWLVRELAKLGIKVGA